MNFQYKVRDAQGQIISAVQEGPSRAAVLKELQERGLHPIAVVPAPSRSAPPPLPVKGKSTAPRKATAYVKRKGAIDSLANVTIGKIVKDQEILLFTRDLYTLIHSGIPLISGIQDIAAQLKNPHFRRILEEVAEDINAGSKLSEAFEKHPKVFSEFYINSIRAGEKSGRMEQILDRLNETLNRDLETTMTIKDAIRYPIIVLSFLALAFIFIVSFVVPKISNLFAQFNTPLPLPTRIIIGVGFISQKYGLLILGCLALAVVFIAFYKREGPGKFLWDGLKLRFPIFGKLFMMVSLSRFAGTMQTLHSSGIVLPKALQISSRVVGNEVISSGILKAYEGVNSGKSLVDSLSQNRFFPPLVLKMIMMGEKTGNLEEMLGEVVRHYDREIRYMTESMTSLIEPILTVALGAMITVFALGVFLPMWNVMKLFKHA